ncbi:MAG TPA: TetR/AcrR family transcriptional regulator [Spirochaetota bacterium]
MPAKGQRRKQQIIETAKEMFLTQGFQSSHIGQVCDKLNIARGTVYQYFGNKREILYAILDDVEEKIADIFDSDDLTDYLKTNPGKEAMSQFTSDRMSRCLKTLFSEPIVIRLIFKEITGIDDEVVERVHKFIENISKIIVNDVDELRARGFLRRSVHADVIAKIVIGGVILLVHECERQKKDPMSKEIITSYVEAILNGIA